MLNDLVLLHSYKKTEDKTWPQNCLKVQTCMREYALIHRFDFKPEEKHWDIYRGPEAYKYLLEVLCGLHSRIFGETEVFGQFKQACEEQQNQLQTQSLFKILNWIKKDVKDLRQQYIKGACLNSYGSMIRKVVNKRDWKISILGSGQLSASIVPWLREGQLNVYGTYRNEDIEKHTHIATYDLLKESDCNCMVIANNMTDIQIIDLLGSDLPDQIIDLRGEGQLAGKLNTEVVGLQDFFNLFGNLDLQKKQVARKVDLAIGAVVKDRFNQQMIRPFGWEDLCS